MNQFYNDMKFTNGDGFYPDYKDGQYGFNTDPERGADTFVPFKHVISGDVAYVSNEPSFVATSKRIKYLAAFQTNQYPIWFIYNADFDENNAWFFRRYSNTVGTTPIDGSRDFLTISDNGFTIWPMTNSADSGNFIYFFEY